MTDPTEVFAHEDEISGHWRLRRRRMNAEDLRFVYLSERERQVLEAALRADAEFCLGRTELYDLTQRLVGDDG